MGAKLTFSFKFDQHIGFPPPAVRIWVDSDNDFTPEAGEEVQLTQAGLEWVGSYQLNAATSLGVWYLVAYSGSLGAKMSLTVTSDGPQEHPVAIASATVKKLRETFWGMCAA